MLMAMLLLTVLVTLLLVPGLVKGSTCRGCTTFKGSSVQTCDTGDGSLASKRECRLGVGHASVPIRLASTSSASSGRELTRPWSCSLGKAPYMGREAADSSTGHCAGSLPRLEDSFAFRDLLASCTVAWSAGKARFPQIACAKRVAICCTAASCEACLLPELQLLQFARHTDSYVSCWCGLCRAFQHHLTGHPEIATVRPWQARKPAQSVLPLALVALLCTLSLALSDG